MLFFTYLRSELRHRLRQAIVTGTGLAVGIGLVIMVSAAATGVRDGQATVLRSLYGVGTDITVTRPWSVPNSTQPQQAQNGPGSPSQRLDFLLDAGQGLFPAASVTSVARLPKATAAVGWIALVDQQIAIPAGGGPGAMTSMLVDGVDVAHRGLGPLSQATIVVGRGFITADANANVALVDAGYAAAHHLRPGSPLTVAHVPFTVVGLVRQPAGAAANVLIPLVRAQTLAGVPGKINTISVQAASDAAVSALSRQIKAQLPWAIATNSGNLAGDITGSLDSAAQLAGDLGRWVAAGALVAAVALASLLTLAATSRRVREFGTLKALGWRGGRVVRQIVGESAAVGMLGAFAGVLLGHGGAALLGALAPRLTAIVAYAPGSKEGQAIQTVTQNGVTHQRQFSPLPGPTTASRCTSARPSRSAWCCSPWRSGSAGRCWPARSAAGPSGADPAGPATDPGTGPATLVDLHAPVTIDTVLVAVLLGIAGDLLAGAIGGWPAARLRPADAMTRVG